MKTFVRFTVLGAGALALLTAAALSAVTGTGASPVPGIVHQASIRGGDGEVQPGDDRGQDAVGAAVVPAPPAAADDRGQDQDREEAAGVRDEPEPAGDGDRQRRGPDQGAVAAPSCDRGPGSADSRGPGSGGSRGPGSGTCRH